MNERGPVAALTRNGAAVLLGAGLVLGCALVRAMANSEPFPYWGADPLQVDTPTTGVTPAVSVLLDVAAVLGAVMVFAAMARRGVGPRVWEVVGVAAGVAVVGWHALVSDGGSLDNLITGGVWVSALVSGLAARVAAADRRARAVMAGLMLGSAVVFAGKGMMQLLVEHPDTVRAYRENRAAFLSAQGWSEGSSMARAFERRLMQPEASGWFGLSNVYASVVAASFVALAALLVGWWRRRGEAAGARDLPREMWVPVMLAIGAAAAAGGLVMSKSKGGIGAAAVGCALLAVVVLRPGWVKRWKHAGAAIGLGLCAMMLGAVMVRGLVGERIGELSLLFRWFYMEGAARIFGSHLGLGVGPADFKAAYLLAKPALSPEEVTSPHSVLWDYAATLGVGGLAWGVLLLSWVARAGGALVREDAAEGAGDEPPESFREDVRVVLVVAALATVAGTYLESPAVTISSTLMRLVAMGVWVGVGAAVMMLARRGAFDRVVSVALACGALVLAVHGQIEVTPVWQGSAGWFMVVMGLAAGRRTSPGLAPGRDSATSSASPEGDGRRAGLVMVAVAVLITGVEAWAGVGVWRWERTLKSTAAIALDIAGMRAELQAAAGMRPGWDPQGSARELSAELARRLGRPVGPSPAALHAELREYEIGALGSMLREMRRTAEASLPHFPTVRAASRVALEKFAAEGDVGRETGPSGREAEDLIVQFLKAHRDQAEAWAWLGTLRGGLARSMMDPAERQRLGRATAEAWERAAELDPYSLQYAPDLARLYRSLGDVDRAQAWARRALKIHELHHLDPLQQLRPDEVAEMRGIAG